MMMLTRADPPTGDPPRPSLFREGVVFSFSILSIILYYIFSSFKFQVSDFKIKTPSLSREGWGGSLLNP
jgi:hypothetical protein